MLESDTFHSRVAVFTVALEVFRYQHMYFLASSHRGHEGGSWPTIVDLQWDRTSVVVHSLQYLSTVLAGESPRLVILFQASATTTMVDLKVRHPQIALSLRRALVTGICMCDVRNRKLTELPYPVFGSIDTRRSVADRTAVFGHLQGSNPCCLRFSAKRMVALEDAGGPRLDGPQWRESNQHTSTVLPTSIGICERMHSLNKHG